jgi:hypothetical protein
VANENGLAVEVEHLSRQVVLESFARLNLVQLGRQVLVLDEKGSLGLVSLTDAGLRVHSRMQLPVDKAWSAPSVVGRRVYVRTNTTLFALELP